MSGYSPRKAPNVSQYIANLNTLPSAHDLATQQQDGYPLDDDLAIFTNAEFFDFDIGENIDQSAVGYDATREDRARQTGAVGKNTEGEGLNFDDSKSCPCRFKSSIVLRRGSGWLALYIFREDFVVSQHTLTRAYDRKRDQIIIHPKQALIRPR